MFVSRRIKYRMVVPLLLLLAMPVGAGAEEAPAEVLEPDVGPVLSQFVEATYPPAALRDGREGAVLLEMLVLTR